MKNNYNRIVLILIVVSLLVFLAGLSGRGITLKYLFNYLLVNPVKSLMYSIREMGKDISTNVALIKSKTEIDAENRKLKEENELLNARLKLLIDNYYENQQLKEELKVKQQNPFKFDHARVIGFDYINQYFYIDLGSSSGINKNMPVALTYDGELINLVGVVCDVSPFSSRVMLSINPFFKVGVRNLGKASYEVATGNSENLIITTILSSVRVSLGDVYVTSGISSIYPENLVVGKVVKIDEKSSVERDIYLKPLVDLKSLTYVMVITGND